MGSITMDFDTCVSPEFGIEVQADYTYRAGLPGRLSGPPEDCYPPEPAEVEWDDVVVTRFDEDGNETEGYDGDITDDQWEAMYERACEDAEDYY